MKGLTVGLVVVSLTLSVLIGLSLRRGGFTGDGMATPGGAGPARRAPRIGLSLDTLKEIRWLHERDIFAARVRELGGTVEVLSANSDDMTQIRQVQSLITSGVDVIVIVPHDGAAMARGVEEARRAGIPVIAYDRLITDCDLSLYLSFDNEKVGEAQARYLVDHLPTPGQGDIVRIYGAPTDNNARIFKQGQDNVVAPLLGKGDLRLVHENWAADWRPDKAKDIMNAAVTKAGSAIVGALVSNDGTAGGAIQALKEAGLAGKVVVTGQDAELAACQRIVEGSQSMTVYKPVARLARRAAEIAMDLAAGKAVDAPERIDNGRKEVPALYLDIMVVDKDTMIDTVVKDGFHSYDDIYRAVPEDRRPPRP